MRINIEKIQEKVFNNSLQTCNYVEGYENSNSTITVKCIKHNHIFQTRYENVKRDNRAHHICPICQKEDVENKYENLRTNVKCAYCGKEFIKTNSRLSKSKSGLCFCCREHKDLAQRLDSGEKFDILRPEHYGTTSQDYRDIAFRNYEPKCAICGYDEEKFLLEVHHIDENHSNNSLDNLIILCPICHRKLTSKKYKLIDRQNIEKIN